MYTLYLLTYSIFPLQFPYNISGRREFSNTNDDQRWESIKENKKVRKQENKKTRTRPRKWSRKKESFFFFSWSLSWSSSCFLVFLIAFLVEFLFSFSFSWSLSWSNSCFLVFFDRFLGRDLVFLFFYFLVFFFINSDLWRLGSENNSLSRNENDKNHKISRIVVLAHLKPSEKDETKR